MYRCGYLSDARSDASPGVHRAGEGGLDGRVTCLAQPFAQNPDARHLAFPILRACQVSGPVAVRGPGLTGVEAVRPGEGGQRPAQGIEVRGHRADVVVEELVASCTGLRNEPV